MLRKVAVIEAMGLPEDLKLAAVARVMRNFEERLRSVYAGRIEEKTRLPSPEGSVAWLAYERRRFRDHPEAPPGAHAGDAGALAGQIESLAGRIDGHHAELKREIARLDRKIDTLTRGVDAIDCAAGRHRDREASRKSDHARIPSLRRHEVPSWDKRSVPDLIHMNPRTDRTNFDSHWLAEAAGRDGYTRFAHRPIAERSELRDEVKDHLAEAILDHHIAPQAVSGALRRRGFNEAAAYLASRLPADDRTRTGNFGEVLASEHLRQCHGYEMPVFKLRFMDNPRMPMRGEDVIAFRLDDRRTIVALCVGESKASKVFDSREVEDAHERLKQAYRPHPVSLAMISNILHDKGDSLAEQVDAILEELSKRPVRRENWIFIFTASRPRDPFAPIQGLADVVENLTCVDLQIEGMDSLITELFERPLGRNSQGDHS